MTPICLGPSEPSGPRLTHGDRFRGFFFAGISGVAGVLPLARRIAIERRHWLTDAEFSHLFSVWQFLPGSNIVNFVAAFAFRHRGLPSAAAAVIGLLATPATIVIALGASCTNRYGTLPFSIQGLGGTCSGSSWVDSGYGNQDYPTGSRHNRPRDYRGRCADAALGFKVAIATGDSHDAAHLAHFSSWRMR